MIRLINQTLIASSLPIVLVRLSENKLNMEAKVELYYMPESPLVADNGSVHLGQWAFSSLSELDVHYIFRGKTLSSNRYSFISNQSNLAGYSSRSLAIYSPH